MQAQAMHHSSVSPRGSAPVPGAPLQLWRRLQLQGQKGLHGLPSHKILTAGAPCWTDSASIGCVPHAP